MTEPKTLIRRLIYHLIDHSNNLIKGEYPGIKVLCYHDIVTSDWRFAVNPDQFEKQLTHLATYANFISSSKLYDFVTGHKSNISGFLLTFDDGLQSIFDIRDIINRLYFKPIVFLLSDPANANFSQLGAVSGFLTKDQIKILDKDGWEFGCHSATHADFNTLTPSHLYKEVVTSKKQLEDKYGIPIKFFAYPKGVYNKMIRDMVEAAGYSLAFSMDDSQISPTTDPLAIPRIGVDNSHDFREFKAAYSDRGVSFRQFVKNYFPSYARL
ncbi:MAG: polysaccharide deacetylase family protein [Patescibacteria group bacterium]|jgi:peptidoglycan/xylan/chitin deacetylase (PgdA/CDA1 family)